MKNTQGLQEPQNSCSLDKNPHRLTRARADLLKLQLSFIFSCSSPSCILPLSIYLTAVSVGNETAEWHFKDDFSLGTSSFILMVMIVWSHCEYGETHLHSCLVIPFIWTLPEPRSAECASYATREKHLVLFTIPAIVSRQVQNQPPDGAGHTLNFNLKSGQ